VNAFFQFLLANGPLVNFSPKLAINLKNEVFDSSSSAGTFPESVIAQRKVTRPKIPLFALSDYYLNGKPGQNQDTFYATD